MMSTKEEQLLDACERGELQTVRELVESKAVDPNRVVEQRRRMRCHGWLTEGWTPLHYASMQGHFEIVKFLNMWLTKLSVNTKDKEYGMVPLHYACWAGHLEVVKVLFSNSKLDADAKDSDGRTPLHLACMSRHHKVVQCVISNAKLSDADIADYVLHWAFRKGAKNHEVINILAEQGIKQTKPPDLQNEYSKTCKICYKDFNIGRKRYQCRICWDEVCAACSKHKVSITDPSSKPERACDRCFDILSALRNKILFETIKSADSGAIGNPMITTAQGAESDMKCPVCLNIQVDPCTLQCGHSICQLCLARLWKNDDKVCPVCKETWKEFPAVSYNYKANIESSYGHHVAQLRKSYSQEDNELIKEVLETKASLKSDIPTAAQKTTATKEEMISDFWKLRGVEECADTSVIVRSSQGQLVEWNGLKLHIHAGSLPEGLQQCTIFIKASLAGEYEIPENTSLVSAIFWLRCEPQCTFTKPITVEIQHCSTKRDLSKLKIVRAFCNQKSLPYKFKPLGGRFDAGDCFGAVDVKGFSGFGAVEEGPASEKLYYSQLFYHSYSRKRHEIHIIFAWNTEAHINYVTNTYSEDNFQAGCYSVVELLDENFIKVDLARAKWTKVMDGQWEIHPAKQKLTKAELDDFKLGRRIPNCVLEARPLCEDFPHLLHEITLKGIKPPHNELVLSYMPSRIEPEMIRRTASSDSNTGEGNVITHYHGQSTEITGTRLRWSDHPDVYHKLKPHAAKWVDIGDALGFEEGEITNIQSNPMLLTQSAPKSYLREMLSQWLQWAPGDGRGSTGFATRESLRAALLRANLGQLAEQFQ